MFDYFNLIVKDYELAYEKYRDDENYKNEIKDFREQIETEYIDKKFEDEVKKLTKEKTQELVDRKQQHINAQLMRIMKEGQGADVQSDLLMEFMKYDDLIFINEGFRREAIDKAIKVHNVEA